NAASQSVTVSATVSSPGGAVNEGTETFTVLSGTNPVGTPVTVNVTNGAASSSYTVPAGQAPGTYTLKALYNGTGNFASSLDTSHTLLIGAVTTTPTASNVSAAYSLAAQAVSLTAAVTSGAGPVNEGTETFTILDGTTVIGVPVTVNVTSGSASAIYILP